MRSLLLCDGDRARVKSRLCGALSPLEPGGHHAHNTHARDGWSRGLRSSAAPTLAQCFMVEELGGRSKCGAGMSVWLTNNQDEPGLRSRWHMVREYISRHKQCPRCHHISVDPFPAEARAPVQYGPTWRCLWCSSSSRPWHASVTCCTTCWGSP